jgi:hypothetical protein
LEAGTGIGRIEENWKGRGEARDGDTGRLKTNWKGPEFHGVHAAGLRACPGTPESGPMRSVDGFDGHRGDSALAGRRSSPRGHVDGSDPDRNPASSQRETVNPRYSTCLPPPLPTVRPLDVMFNWSTGPYIVTTALTADPTKIRRKMTTKTCTDGHIRIEETFYFVHCYIHTLTTAFRQTYRQTYR